jgi:hypothetical protein
VIRTAPGMSGRSSCSAVFQVTRVRHYARTGSHHDGVWRIDHAGLRLITCGGHDLVSGRYETTSSPLPD